MENLDAYGIYNEALENGHMKILTKSINSETLDVHFGWIINILSDGIETKQVQNIMIDVEFTDGIEVTLTIFDYLFNLIFWTLPASVNEPIDSKKIFFVEDITKSAISGYIDRVFISKYRKLLPFIQLNNIIDGVFGKFRELRKFQMYLANTVCLEDTIELMNMYPEFDETIHLDLTNVPIEDVKDRGMQAANIQAEYIKNSNHCLRDSFRTGEAVSIKQYKEVQASIGSKPDGQGSVFPSIINNSFINGGLQSPEAVCIESSVGRIAQILQKTNVGSSGAFARILGLNNIDTRLNDDPNYVCGTKNFEKITIKNSTILDLYNMRYYRTNPKGVDKLLDSRTDKHLIGQTLYFRSPMTCASKAAGNGICYRCYGDLAYVNRDINIGKIAAELLSSIYTQILLSAKHLLESLVIRMNWSGPFAELFNLTFNTIQLKEDMDYKGYNLVIDGSDMDSEDELDELDYNYFLTSIVIRDPEGNIHRIHTEDSDNIYIHSDLFERIDKLVDAANDSDDVIEVPLESIKDIPILFVMRIKNNELSATMDKVKNIINNKSVTKGFDKDQIIEAFVDTNIAGGIRLNAVHFEVLLSNQIRSDEDILDNPDWTIENAGYQLLPLSAALANNQSINIRLLYTNLSKTLFTPSSFKVRRPSNLDLFFMEKPQEFIYNDNVVDEGNKLINDIENNLTCPIKFFNPEDEKEEVKK